MKAEKEKLTLKGIFKKILKYGTYIGAGAVAGCALKGVDLSGLKGVTKACAGLGILGISTAVADSAAEAVGKKFDEVIEVADDLSKEGEDEEEVVIDDADIPDVEVANV